MAIQYEWRFGPMKTETINGIPNVVTHVNYMCIAQDLERSSKATGAISGSIPVPSPDPNNFITLDNLTSSVLEGWINQGIQKSDVESSCTELLENELTPPVQWVNVSTNVSNDLTTNLSTPGFVPFSSTNDSV